MSRASPRSDRNELVNRILLGFALALVACGGDTDETPSPTPAAVTLRFRNPTTADVFVDATYRPYDLRQGDKVLAGSYDCVPSCGSGCSCYYCGAPMDVVRRIAPGAEWQVTWAGDWYELVQGGCGGGQCSCDRPHVAPFGATKVEIVGARGKTPAGGAPTPSDPDVYQGSVDTSVGTCTGTATFELDAEAKSVDVPFTCSN